jgi:hypothetical protein
LAGSVISLDLGNIGGVFIGAAIGCANLAAIRWLCERAAANPDQRQAVMAAFTVKFVLLIGIVGAVVLLVDFNEVAFIIGFSTMVLAVMLVPILSIAR